MWNSLDVRTRTAWLVAGAAALASACASTGAVPKPFPMPGGPPAGSAVASTPRATGAPDLYAVTSTALALRGRPYRNGGSDPRGFDCSGFTQYVFGQHGVQLPRNVRDQFQAGKAVKAKDLAVGDLVFFTTVARGASHVGIVIGGDQFVHAPSEAGVVRVERISAPYWSRRYVGARRIR